MRNWTLAVVLVGLSPIIAIGILAGLVWSGLRIGFQLVNIKLMEYILDD